MNRKDPNGNCETCKNGSTGVCAKDPEAAKLVDAAKDKNSKISAIDKQTINDGKEIKVSTGSTKNNIDFENIYFLKNQKVKDLTADGYKLIEIDDQAIRSSYYTIDDNFKLGKKLM